MQAAVDAVNLTANFDKPEGLLDGLMQAMVCGVGYFLLKNIVHNYTFLLQYIKYEI